MCSISGVVWTTPHSPEETLELVRSMNRALRHRGPDGEGAAVVAGGRLTRHHWDGRGGPLFAPVSTASRSATTLGLGMNRLSIRDVEAGHQPMADRSDQVTIVFNGEIYNTEELGAELAGSGVTFRTRSDTEVLLEAYMRWGRACVEKLAGMFAFAIWDERDQSLFIARDRLGIKPLVWARTKEAILFGSELKALLATGLVAKRVRRSAVDQFLFHLYVPAPNAPLEDVHVLEPGHTLLLKNGELRIQRYWSLSFAPGAPKSLDVHAETFKTLFDQAVGSHLLSDVPVGAFLSGGLDSSAVVATMKRLGQGQVHTYTVGFDVKQYDESSDAAEAARFIGTEHEEVRVSITDLENDIVRVLSHYDQPFADPSAVPTYVLCRETAKRVKVALAGDGSDEQLAGYPRARHFAMLEAARRSPAAARAAFAWALDRAAPLLGGYRRRVRNLADYANVLRNGGASDPMSAYIHLRHVFRNGWHGRILTPDFAEHVGREDPSFHIHAVADQSSAVDPITRLLEVEVHTYLPNDILMKVDMASGAHGLEVRVPFLDHRLVEAVAAMPLQAKLGLRRTKVVLREALRGSLPPGALRKRKQGFHLPVAQWLRGAGKGMLFDTVLSQRATQRGYFRPEVLRQLADEHVEQRADHSGMLWSLLGLEIWHRTWVD
ncbi:MAG: asparagine synthase (glutamine-hydrolyzing) [Polyangiaceae bacterium]|nr:asparagine synthase (glutamine-hydrolyzing) [Polyangiaceae bacterium]